MNTTACKTLADRIEVKRAAGLVDVKFYLANRDEASFDQVCEEVNGLYDALADSSKVAPLSFMTGAGA